MPPYFRFPESMQAKSELTISDFRDGALEASIAKQGMDDIDWIIEGLRAPGKTKVGLAKALQRSPSMVTNLLAGDRRLKASEIPVIARYLEVAPPPAQIASAGSATKRAKVVDTVSIIGEVAGGVWSEPSLEFEPIPTDVARDVRWPVESVYLLRVKGTSVNRQAKDGDLVLCLDKFAAPRSFQSGDWVIVERRRGGLVETTVKKVGHAFDGEWMLEPDSDDRQHQSPLSTRAAAGEEVEVKAFVLDFIRRGTSFF